MFNRFLLTILLVVLIQEKGNSKEIRKEQPKSATAASAIQSITLSIPGLMPKQNPLVMVLIKAGTFRMGSPPDERGRFADYEWPPHEVHISQDFYISQYEITQAQWFCVMNYSPQQSFVLPNHPVTQVSWKDCVRFCNRLSFNLGLTQVYDEKTWQADWSANGFRLPTEAEWEYACRAGTQTRFWFGDALESKDAEGTKDSNLDPYLWWYGSYDPQAKFWGISEVGLKRPNPWGLYDMHGNVMEWCHDCWIDPYPRGRTIDPRGPEEGYDRIYRGGACQSYLRDCRAAYREMRSADADYTDIGFRIVKNKQ